VQWSSAWAHLLACTSSASPEFCLQLVLTDLHIQQGSFNHRLLPALLNLRRVEFMEKGCEDRYLYALAKLRHLEALAVPRASVSPHGLKLLASGRPAETLRALDLRGCPGIDDDAVAQLGGLLSLRWLNISDCNVSDNGVQELVQLCERDGARGAPTRGEEALPRG